MTTAQWADPFEPESMRQAVSKILTGTNYRLFHEPITRAKLISTYAELSKLAHSHAGDDAAWRAELEAMLADPQTGPLRQWLLGLTKKTAQNLEVKVSDYPRVFDQVMSELEDCPPGLETRGAALLLWSGAATLTIRGSAKARIGKALERACTAATLTAIGLRPEEHYWLDIAADDEVDRQIDAEVATTRGRVRIEVGFIGIGNPEVIGDKVGRLDRNGVVMFDTLPASSSMWETARRRGVRLIPMRNNHPVEELRQHLGPLGAAVQGDPISVEQVEQRIMAMPLTRFAPEGSTI